MTRWDAAGRAGSGVPRASLRPAASDAGAAPLVPRPCFTVKDTPNKKKEVKGARKLSHNYPLELALTG